MVLLAQESSAATGAHTAALVVSGGSGAPAGGQEAAVVRVGRGGARGGSGEWGSRLLLAALRKAFLPEGYPHTVTPDYVRYQLWDSVQALATYVRGILSSQAVLQGVGVGRAAATPLSAVTQVRAGVQGARASAGHTLLLLLRLQLAFPPPHAPTRPPTQPPTHPPSQFLVRDLTGMLGGVLFATAQGASLDAHAKQWRLFADCMNDLGLALELASPLAPSAFLALACAGSLARALTGVAGGATRTALTQHFALARNAADISAKEGSQEVKRGGGAQGGGGCRGGWAGGSPQRMAAARWENQSSAPGPRSEGRC